MKVKLVAIIQPSNKGLAKNFSAYCPDMPGYIAHGRTEAKALATLQAALSDQIHTLKALGVEPPTHQCKIKILEI